MRIAKTLIRLGGCPGWSVFAGRTVICWFCHEGSQLWDKNLPITATVLHSLRTSGLKPSNNVVAKVSFSPHIQRSLCDCWLFISRYRHMEDENTLWVILTHLAHIANGKKNRVLFCNNSLGRNAWRYLATFFFYVILPVDHVSLMLDSAMSFLRARYKHKKYL